MAELSATMGRNVSEVADCVDSPEAHATVKSGLSLRRGWAVALLAYKASAELRKAATGIGAVAASALHKLGEHLRQRSWAADAERLRKLALQVYATAVFHYRNSLARLREYAFEHGWAEDAARLQAAAQRLCALALYRLRHTPKSQLAVIVALAFFSGSFGYLMMGVLWSRPAIVAAGTPSAPAPAPTAMAFATSYEVDRAQKSDRLLLAVSPADLLSLYERKGADAVEVYKDGWVRLDYPIVSFGKQSFGKVTYDTVEATAHFNSAFPGTVIAFFDEQQWDARLRKHRPNDRLVAFCQFATIDKVQFLANIYRLWFYGTGCELPLY